jgi:aminoglycoside phosphotransferase (APT) family kinase protein
MLQHPWEPQQTLESQEALDLIKTQFPELCPSTIRLLGAGWDNTAFIIDEKLIFRFPRRDCTVALLESEWNILPRIAPQLPLQIPIPQWKGMPSPSFSWPFIGHTIVPGITACSANLSEEERASFAPSLAHFLSILHAPSMINIAKCPSFETNASHLHWKNILPKILKNFEELSTLHLLEKRKELESIAESLPSVFSPLSTAVVHGDFYVRHLLIDKERRLCGVIDWGDMHLGDPAIDIAIAHSFLPKSAHAAFRKAYGDISESTWNLSLLRAIFSCSSFALYGYYLKDQVLLKEALRALKIMSM